MDTTERVTMAQGAAMLGVSHAKMWKLVRDGLLPAERNPLDGREKLVRVSDILALQGNDSTQRPWPRTVGAADLGVQSEDIEDWLEANWRPC